MNWLSTLYQMLTEKMVKKMLVHGQMGWLAGWKTERRL